MSDAETTGGAARVKLSRAEVQKLAEKVYQLMLADARLERAREGRTQRHKQR
ncbi:MAG: hypothetical protein RLZZ387_5052 [Chloroflexota bacterium]|jgi:hypothetical protein